MMVVMLRVRTTGSAEIVVTAGSSTDKNVDIDDFLGYTVGYVLRRLGRKGYQVEFVTDTYLVCTKSSVSSCTSSSRLTLFNAKRRCAKR